MNSWTNYRLTSANGGSVVTSCQAVWINTDIILDVSAVKLRKAFFSEFPEGTMHNWNTSTNSPKVILYYGRGGCRKNKIDRALCGEKKIESKYGGSSVKRGRYWAQRRCCLYELSAYNILLDHCPETSLHNKFPSACDRSSESWMKSWIFDERIDISNKNKFCKHFDLRMRQICRP